MGSAQRACISEMVMFHGTELGEVEKKITEGNEKVYQDHDTFPSEAREMNN